MKKLLCVLAIIGILLCSGCSADGNKILTDDRFQVVEKDISRDRRILVDTETKVMYLKYVYGITVLLDTDGKPLLWEGELE